MASNIPRRRKAAKASALRDASRPAARPAAKPKGKQPQPDRRGLILSAATSLFAKLGFEATSVRQIADEVNILSGSLYHHFETKDEMLHEIVRDAVEQMRDNAIRIAEAPVDAEHRLIALILLDLGELTRNQEVHAILSNERRLFRQREEFAYIVEAKRGAYHAWRSVLQDGIADKLFRPDLDIFLAISTVVRMLNTAADWYVNEEASIADSAGAYGLDDIIDFYLGFILGAVRTPARAAEPIPREACEGLATFRN
ncbi:TetR/AcrR family transcriptional regulator [Phenylobacterium sp. LjRoot225]|uniref:TetR/AcrR family transcriptional regulator n=1 Tax=Phenylobacterium sp. LjRoot225 TaxID=3342285 RepID=UPI003F50CA41